MVSKRGLLATKLHCPSLPAKWVQRTRLRQKLQDGLALNRSITLVSAPAGFGKTTLLSEWVDTLPCPVSWLSLDAEDDDPGRFFTYLVAALQKIDSRLGEEIEGVLGAGQIPPGRIISTSLINDILARRERFLLVLDDFHVIQDPFILETLEHLVANMPPPLHLVLITREDPPLPLARMRAGNQLTEIRARDLRFTDQDAGRFLNEMMALSLSQEDVAALEGKTEGWIVGLQLAAIAIQAQQSVGEMAVPSDFIASLSGSHRFILSYLTEQVLNQQPEEIQRFLLQTAILDKLNGDLCNAVTGRADSYSMLTQLFNANLFLIPLDDEGQWYRYHHLFADLLRDRQNALHGEETAVLHQRAGQWYAQENRGSEAIRHALAAEDYALAVDLLERHAMPLIMHGYVKSVNGWVEAIPQQWQSQSPQTYLALGWMHLLRGAYTQAGHYLERLQATLAELPPPSQMNESEASHYADWLVMQALMMYKEGEISESETLAERALAIVPDQDSRVRSLAYYALASVYWLREEYRRAADVFQVAIQHARLAQNLVVEIMSTMSLVMMAFEHGQLHLAHEIAVPVIERVDQSGTLPPILAGLYNGLGEVYYQWDQLDQARQHFLRSLQLSQLGGYNTTTIFAHVSLSRLAQLEDDLETAAQELETAVDLLPPELPDYIQQEVAAQQVNLALARNRSDVAEMALQSHGFSYKDSFAYPDLYPNQSMSHSLGLITNSSLRVLLYKTRLGGDLSNLKAGMALADDVIAAAFQAQQIPIALEALLLRAQMHTALGKKESHLSASQADSLRALQLAEPEGFISIFVEQGEPIMQALQQLVRQNQVETRYRRYVERILATFNRLQFSDKAQQAPQLVEPLTERELEVLCLMAEGLKYKEIAARLFISLNTVRYHVKALYGKLHVNNRTQAIEAARLQQIL